MDRNEIVKYGMLLLAIVATAFLFPKSKYFNYDYKKSQLWAYEDLYAPYDFALLKTDSQIEKDEEKIKADFIPVFQKNSVSKESIISLIPDSLENSQQLIEFVSKQYDQGIFDSAELNNYSNELIEKYIDGSSTKIRKALVSTPSKVINELSSSLPQEKLLELSEKLLPNYSLNSESNANTLKALINGIEKERGVVIKGESIARNGEMITEDVVKKLDSLKGSLADSSSDKKGSYFVFAGYLLLTTLIFAVLLLFIRLHYPTIYQSNKEFAFILIWPVLFGFLVRLLESNTELSTYLIPFCIVPIVILNFYSGRLALFIHIITILVASFLSKLGYEFTFLQILAGAVTVLVASETRYWNVFFKVIGIILGVYFLGYFGLELIKEGNFTGFSWEVFGWLFMNGVFLLLAYPFIPIIEKIFGFTSSITLAELGDLNSPLLKELSFKAPGTFQHSLQVANLAEAAVKEIGGNSLLTRVAGLYHDIGKMKQPEFYIENQSNIESPHNQLNNFESAKVIIDHVVEGEKMAVKAKLPKSIIDFITTHHGASRVEYFYRNQLKEDPEGNFDETLFRYPGPNPSTKEQSIMMIADSIEAASKSLKSATGQDIDQLVDKIIDYKIDSGLLGDSNLTFSDLVKTKKVFKTLLRSIYHVRIEYPEEVKKVDE